MKIISDKEKITVNLYGGFESYSPEGKRKGNKIKIYENDISRIRDIIQYFNIPPEEVQVILIDGKHADLNSKISAGSKVSVFPLVGGG